jgi:2-dehydro-3-deoxygalactonokinase
MGWAEGFVAVDWGTTNRRAYRVGPDGALLDEMEDDRGILAVGAGNFEAAVAEIRGRMGDLPLLMAGMIGSNRGWIEAPYAPCPAGLPELAQRVKWVEPGRIGIVPGVAYSEGDAADVMRGEEVQILGAFGEGIVPPDAVICHPGTHNKWIRLEDGRITAFRTVMTGELFNLLKGHSILSDLLSEPAELGPGFEAGVRAGLACDVLTAELFSIRARVLLGKAPREEAASFTSGLLIGADLRFGLAFSGDAEIIVMARPELSRLFAAAAAVAGRSTREIDGETAFLAGARHLAELVQ